jgi:hypothetical protein
MKMQNKLWLALVGTLIVGTGSAQTWTVDGLNQASQLTTNASQSAVAVDPATGQVDLVTGTTINPTLTIQSSGAPTVNQLFTVSYTATNFTPSVCTATSTPTLTGWNGVLTGTSSQASSTTAGTFSLSLSCTRAGGSPVTSNTLSVTVTNPNTNCPAPNILGATTIRGATVFASDRPFQATFTSPEVPNPTFPAPTGVTSQPFDVQYNEVTAIAFVMPTGGLPTDGTLQASESPTAARGIPIIALSDCRGDTRTSLNTGARSCVDGGFSGQTAGVSWTDTDNNFPQSFQKCRLTPGVTYFINIASTCSFNGACGLLAKTISDTNQAEQ